jgi:hypothetical protein
VFSGTGGKYGEGWNGTGTDECSLKFAMTPAGTISGGTHSHTVSVSISESGSHSHTISGGITGSTANTGDGAEFNIDTVPTYFTVIYIIKVA